MLIAQNAFHSIAQTPTRESLSLSHLHHQKHNRESHFGRFGDEVHRHRMVREPASGIFRQVDENGLQTDEEAVRGDQAEREQTLLIILLRRGVWDVLSLAAKGALLVVMEFVRERRRRLVVIVLVVERPPSAVGGEGRHRRPSATLDGASFDSNDFGRDDGRLSAMDK